MGIWDFFKDKSSLPDISFPSNDRKWVEESIIWFAEQFNISHIRERNMYQIDDFLLANNQFDFDLAFTTICKVYDLNPNDVIIRIFDDLETKSWFTQTVDGFDNSAAGLYHESFDGETVKYNVNLAKSTMDFPESVVGVLAHELAHAKLLGGRILDANHPDMEPLTDLFVIFFGFGIFTANISLKYSNVQINKIGYLNNEYIAYALAVMSWIQDKEKSDIAFQLEANTKHYFKEYLKYIKDTKDTLLNDGVLEEIGVKFRLNKELNAAISSKNYKDLFAVSSRLLEINPKDVTSLNNRGFASVMLGNYENALVDLTKGIDEDPFFFPLFSNRGHCYLMMKRYEEAFEDLDSSIRMNGDNVWCLRLLGTYYMETGNDEMAETVFQKAHKMNSSCEWLSYNMGKFYEEKGDIEKAKLYFRESAELNEREGIEALKKYE